MRDITANPEAGLGKVCRAYKDGGGTFLSRLVKIDSKYFYIEGKTGVPMRNYRESISQLVLVEV